MLTSIRTNWERFQRRSYSRPIFMKSLQKNYFQRILTLPDLRGGGGVEPTPKGFSSITFDRDKILQRHFG